MARPPRLQIEGAWYHVIARGIERRPIFKQDRDREHFLELLGVVSARFACNISAYVLMENHFHLFLQTLEPNLSRALQWLTTSYGAWFNRRHDRAGHLFQGRFKAVVVDPNQWAVSLTRYIHLNPIRVKPLGLDKTARQAARQGLSKRPEPEVFRQRVTKLREFGWSSYRAYAGSAKAPDWLKADRILQHGGGRLSQQRAWYRGYCERAIREGIEDAIQESVFQQVCLGGREFLQQLLDDKSRGKLRIEVVHPAAKQVKDAIAQLRDEKWDNFAARHADWGRDMALHIMHEFSGQSLPVLARAFGLGSASAVSIAVRRFAQRLRTDKMLRKLYQQACKLLNVEANC